MAQVFRLNHNCWQTGTATAAHLLIDGSAYYHDLHASLGQARESIVILGWDLCSDVRLSLNDQRPLCQYLTHLLNQNSGLKVKILIWDSFPFFTKYREPKRSLLRNFRHDRLELAFDQSLPAFASFHAKLIVIDDEIAYLGGIDLTANRYDSPAHHPRNSHAHEKRETNCQQSGEFFPIHDVQLRVEGPVAKSLGALAKDQWQRSTGSASSDRLQKETPFKDASLKTQPQNRVQAAIARTQASWNDWPALHEIKNLYCDLIREAKNYIYIECQYLTSRDITACLREALSKKNGPEIILISSQNYHGWWESHTLGAIRNQQIKDLKKADHHRKLGIFYPGHRENSPIAVHSKLMIVDGDYACLGSANLTNRSMYLDSEYCLSLKDSDKPFRLRLPMLWTLQLLSEHLGFSQEFMENRLANGASLLKLISMSRELNSPLGRTSQEARTLFELKESPEDFWSHWLKNKKWSDPDGPLRPIGKMLYPNIAEMPEIFHG